MSKASIQPFIACGIIRRTQAGEATEYHVFLSIVVSNDPALVTQTLQDCFRHSDEARAGWLLEGAVQCVPFDLVELSTLVRRMSRGAVAPLQIIRGGKHE